MLLPLAATHAMGNGAVWKQRKQQLQRAEPWWQPGWDQQEPGIPRGRIQGSAVPALGFVGADGTKPAPNPPGQEVASPWSIPGMQGAVIPWGWSNPSPCVPVLVPSREVGPCWSCPGHSAGPMQVLSAKDRLAVLPTHTIPAPCQQKGPPRTHTTLLPWVQTWISSRISCPKCSGEEL